MGCGAILGLDAIDFGGAPEGPALGDAPTARRVELLYFFFGATRHSMYAAVSLPSSRARGSLSERKLSPGRPYERGMRRLLSTSLALFTTAGLAANSVACGGAARAPAQSPTHTTAATTPAPGDLKALFARESTAELKPVPVSVLDGAVTGAVPAAATPKVTSHENENGELVSLVDIPIGSDVPVTCIFRSGRVDPGAAIAQMIAPITKGDALGGKTFTPEVKVSVADGYPVLVVTSPYVENGATSLGKIAVGARDGGTVLCTHFEAGYRATFTSVVGKVVASLSFTKPPMPDPRWHEVRLMEKAGSIAFEERDVWPAEKAGRFVARSIFASYTELNGQWTGIDGASSQVYEAKGGSVVEQTTRLAVGGAIVSDLKLTRKAAGKYAYEGKQGDHALSGTFATKSPITSEASRAERLKAWLGGKATEARFFAYDEFENAKGATDVVFTRGDGAGSGKVMVETRGEKVQKMLCTLGADGLCDSLDDAEGGFRETRLFVRGTL
jgi:hypothetical protein